MGTNVRARVVISGRVQGVFFRAETQRAAEQAGVRGWVRNRADGTVEALFEGTKEAVDRVIAWCHQGSPASRVTDVSVIWEEFKGEYEHFRVSHSF